jgi:hypothetical protein
MGCFITVREATPATHVVDQNSFVFRFAANNILQQVTESKAVLGYNAAFSPIVVRSHYHKTVMGSIFLDRGSLIVY